MPISCGALTNIQFTLTHYRIGNKDQYVADIASIRVLVPPTPQGPVTLRKRIHKSDPYRPAVESPSPSKISKKRKEMIENLIYDLSIFINLFVANTLFFLTIFVFPMFLILADRDEKEELLV